MRLTFYKFCLFFSVPIQRPLADSSRSIYIFSLITRDRQIVVDWFARLVSGTISDVHYDIHPRRIKCNSKTKGCDRLHQHKQLWQIVPLIRNNIRDLKVQQILKSITRFELKQSWMYIFEFKSNSMRKSFKDCLYFGNLKQWKHMAICIIGEAPIMQAIEFLFCVI